MPNSIELQIRARSLRAEIARLERTISKLSAFNQEDRREELEGLRTVCGQRERELNDVEGRLVLR